MDKKSLVKIGGFLAILVIIFLSGFLFLRPSETEVEEVNLGLGVEGYELEKITNTFYENQYVSLTGKILNLRGDVELYLECYDSENDFVKPNDMTNEKLVEEDFRDTDSFVFSYFPKENRWRIDNYRMEVILDNRIVKVKEFEVVKPD